MPASARASRLPLPAMCAGRCQPRWKLPVNPYLWALLLIPSLVCVILGLSGVVAMSSGGDAETDIGYDDRVMWIVWFIVMLLLAALFAVPAGLWVRRLDRARRQVLAGRRVPVTVYYGRLTRAAFPVAPRPRFRYLSAARVGDLFTQPLLLVAASDGRLWTALPDTASVIARHAPWGNGNNPWIAPLLTLHDDGETVMDPVAARQRRLPVDLEADENRAVLDALRRLGQPEPHDPPEARGVDLYRNDPRTYGGPAPGELLLAAEGRFHGLILHRPADAPASVPLRKRYGQAEYYYFGSDAGLCCGIYLKALTALA